MKQKEEFWYAGDTSKIDTVIRKEISNNVKAAYKHIFKTGFLWLDADDDGVVRFEFTDENFEFRKIFKMSEIEFCGVEYNKESVISSLKQLIKRVEKLEDTYPYQKRQ